MSLKCCKQYMKSRASLNLAWVSKVFVVKNGSVYTDSIRKPKRSNSRAVMLLVAPSMHRKNTKKMPRGYLPGI